MTKALIEVACDKKDWPEVYRQLSQLLGAVPSVSVIIIEKKDS